MFIKLDSEINRYYVQTLAMIFFPGEKFGENEVDEPGTPYCGCALDFRRMREEDSFKNVVFRDIFAREGAELCIACDKVTPDIRN